MRDFPDIHSASSAMAERHERCTVENQGPSTVMTAGLVGMPGDGRGTPGRIVGPAADVAHRCRDRDRGEITREDLGSARLTEDRTHPTLLGMTGPWYGFLFSIPGESERLGQMQRRLVQRQAMHGRPQVQRVALGRASAWKHRNMFLLRLTEKVRSAAAGWLCSGQGPRRC